jgi:hypothetical protein
VRAAPLSARELAAVLNRIEHKLVRDYLSRWCGRVVLAYTVPEMENHPDQRYTLPRNNRSHERHQIVQGWTLARPPSCRAMHPTGEGRCKTLIEKNLVTLLGIRFLASEYVTADARGESLPLGWTRTTAQ